MSYVELSGLTVPTEAYDLVFALSNRGLTLAVDGDRLRVSGPGGSKPTLSSEDADQIRKWKAHLMALVAYRAPAGWEATT